MGMFDLASGRQSVFTSAAILVVHKPHVRDASQRLVIFGPAASPANNDIVVKGIRREAVVEYAFRALVLGSAEQFLSTPPPVERSVGGPS